MLIARKDQKYFIKAVAALLAHDDINDCYSNPHIIYTVNCDKFLHYGFQPHNIPLVNAAACSNTKEMPV